MMRIPARMAGAGLLVPFLQAAAIGAVVRPSPVAAQHLEVPVHDPVMIRAEGTYYLFTTGRGISAWSSPDMETWERLPPVFTEAPAWTEEVVPGFGERNHMWAPDIVEREGTFFLYYSVSAFGRNTSAIGVATNATLDPDHPDHGWVDHGPVIRSIPGRDLWNAIDPNVVVDEDGAPWLTFGSFWAGMKLARLEDGMLGMAEPQEWYTIAAQERAWPTDDRDAGSGVIEAPFLFRKDGFYYLFVSLGRCCRGAASTYRVAVGRASDVRGPYLDREGRDLAHGGGTALIAGDERYAGIGHSAAYTFEGTDYFVAHAYDRSDDGRSKLLILQLGWEDGWPVVELDAH